MALLSACGGKKSAEEVAILYLEALARGDFPAAYAHLCQESRAALSQAEAEHRAGQFTKLAPREIHINQFDTPGLGLFVARVTGNGRVQGPPVGSIARPPAFVVVPSASAEDREAEGEGLRLVPEDGTYRIALKLSGELEK